MAEQTVKALEHLLRQEFAEAQGHAYGDLFEALVLMVTAWACGDGCRTAEWAVVAAACALADVEADWATLDLGVVTDWQPPGRERGALNALRAAALRLAAVARGQAPAHERRPLLRALRAAAEGYDRRYGPGAFPT
jgi:hypothetical protein